MLFTLRNLLFKGFDAFIRALFRTPTRTSKGRKKHHWEDEYRIAEQQFNEGEVSHLDDLVYDPLLLESIKKVIDKLWIRATL